MYVHMHASGCLRQMNRETISDSRVQLRFQRSCWRRKSRKCAGTIVRLIAPSTRSVTRQSRST